MIEAGAEPSDSDARRRRRSVARWISILAHPFVLSVLLVAIAGSRVGTGAGALQAVLLVVAATIVPVSILIAVQMRRGRWSDPDASDPAQRPLLFVVALAVMVALLGWLLLHDPRSFLLRGMLATLALMVVAAGLIRWIKISLHMAFAGMVAITLTLMGTWAGYVLLAVLPLLAWSRLTLSRHRPAEVALGLALGVLVGFALVYS
jgi:hypothetical protein